MTICVKGGVGHFYRNSYCVPVGVGYKVCVSGRLTVGVGQLEMDRRCMTVGE